MKGLICMMRKLIRSLWSSMQQGTKFEYSKVIQKTQHSTRRRRKTKKPEGLAVPRKTGWRSFGSVRWIFRITQKTNRSCTKEVRGHRSSLRLVFRLQWRSSWFPPELYPPLKPHDDTSDKFHLQLWLMRNVNWTIPLNRNTYQGGKESTEFMCSLVWRWPSTKWGFMACKWPSGQVSRHLRTRYWKRSPIKPIQCTWFSERIEPSRDIPGKSIELFQVTTCDKNARGWRMIHAPKVTPIRQSKRTGRILKTVQNAKESVRN